METRPLGKTGLTVSRIGLCLPPDAAVADALMRRAMDEGVTFFVASDASLAATPGALVAIGPRNGVYLLSGPVPGLGYAVQSPADLPADPGIVFARYNLVDQEAGRELFPVATKRGHGIVATRTLAGGALAGRVAHAPPGAAIAAFAKLVTPRRTLAQAAILFTLANEYVSCALLRVSSAAHLREALGAPDAEPLSAGELEFIFEAWANRYDRK